MPESLEDNRLFSFDKVADLRQKHPFWVCEKINFRNSLGILCAVVKELDTNLSEAYRFY